MQMKTKLALIAAAALALVACSDNTGEASSDDTLIVKIGHVAPTSGAIVHLGKDNENGARMAIEELNASGMTIGGKPVTFEHWLKTMPLISEWVQRPRSGWLTQKLMGWLVT